MQFFVFQAPPGSDRWFFELTGDSNILEKLAYLETTKRGKRWEIDQSLATVEGKGYGRQCYLAAIQWVSKKGGALVSRVNETSSAAKYVRKWLRDQPNVVVTRTSGGVRYHCVGTCSRLVAREENPAVVFMKEHGLDGMKLGKRRASLLRRILSREKLGPLEEERSAGVSNWLDLGQD